MVSVVLGCATQSQHENLVIGANIVESRNHIELSGGRFSVVLTGSGENRFCRVSEIQGSELAMWSGPCRVEERDGSLCVVGDLLSEIDGTLHASGCGPVHRSAPIVDDILSLPLDDAEIQGTSK